MSAGRESLSGLQRSVLTRSKSCTAICSNAGKQRGIERKQTREGGKQTQRLGQLIALEHNEQLKSPKPDLLDLVLFTLCRYLDLCVPVVDEENFSMRPSMEPSRTPVSESERQILHVLWDLGPRTVREVQESLVDRGQSWQRSTVITLLQRLEKKGYVSSDKDSHAFVFKAIVSRDDMVCQRLSDVAQEYCAGASTPLLLAFAKRQKFTPDEITQLKNLVKELSARPDKDQK